MATVQIYFYFDTKQTLASKSPGSLDQPTALTHPQLQWVDGNGNKSGLVKGDTPVPVQQNDTVEIYVIDYDSTAEGISPPRLQYSLAPVRFLAGTWTSADDVNQTKQTCTKDFLTSDNSPMGGVNFEVMHERYYDLAYKNTGDPGWTTDSSYFTSGSNWFPAGAACEVMDADPQSPVVLGPYINFTFNDLPGTLFYGLEVEVAVSGQGKKYYCWDPNIVVQKPNT